MSLLMFTSLLLVDERVSATSVQLQAAGPVAEGWIRGARAEPTVQLKLILALHPQRLEHLHQEVLAMSSPRSDRYGQHLSSSELARLTTSNDAQVRVEHWLGDAGVRGSWSRWGDRLELSASVAAVERLLGTEVHEYVRPGQTSVLEATALHVPRNVSSDLGAVFGLHGNMVVERRFDRSLPTAGAVTPSLIREYYGIGSVTVARGSGNKRAAVAFQGQYTSSLDLSTFFQQFVNDSKPGDDKFTCVPDSCEGTPGIEAQLDAQYLMGVVPGIETELWAFQEGQWCTALKRWTAAVLDADDPPSVFSVSYGVQYNTTDYERFWGCTEEMAFNIETDFAKIAARGVSIIFASGDSGSAGGTRTGIKLWPAWPGSASHVTAVGATAFVGGDPAAGERSSTSFASGGGFDWRWARPSWQADDVKAYLDNAPELPQESDFDRTGRATPDLSAIGEAYQVINNGATKTIGGTSASAPTFASMVSLLNEYRVQNGQSPLGFLNPLIYEMASAGQGWSDIVIGDDKPNPSCQGFVCTKGWDPVTGLGTPKFQELLSYIKTLPLGKPLSSVVV